MEEGRVRRIDEVVPVVVAQDADDRRRCGEHLVQARALDVLGDGPRCALRHRAEQSLLGVAERARTDRADVSDAEHLTLVEQRHRVQPLGAARTQPRASDECGRRDLRELERPSLCRDTTGEALSNRDRVSLVDLLVQADAGGDAQLASVAEEHGRRVRVVGRADEDGEQLSEERRQLGGL